MTEKTMITFAPKDVSAKKEPIMTVETSSEPFVNSTEDDIKPYKNWGEGGPATLTTLGNKIIVAENGTGRYATFNKEEFLDTIITMFEGMKYDDIMFDLGLDDKGRVDKEELSKEPEDKYDTEIELTELKHPIYENFHSPIKLLYKGEVIGSTDEIIGCDLISFCEGIYDYLPEQYSSLPKSFTSIPLNNILPWKLYLALTTDVELSEYISNNDNQSIIDFDCWGLDDSDFSEREWVNIRFILANKLLHMLGLPRSKEAAQQVAIALDQALALSSIVSDD